MAICFAGYGRHPAGSNAGVAQEQAGFLDETQRAMAAWTKRRQDAMEATFRTFQAMGGCKDPAAMSAPMASG